VDSGGDKSAEKFVENAYEKIDVISNNPYMYKALGADPDVRVAFITPQVSIVYKMHPNHIYRYIFGITGSNRLPNFCGTKLSNPSHHKFLLHLPVNEDSRHSRF
jgi:hypothetical protein